MSVANDVSAGGKNDYSNIYVPVCAVVALLLLWEAGVWLFKVPTYIAPAPSDVGHTLVEKFPLLLTNFVPTFYESVFGFFAGNLAAILIAIAFVHNKFVEKGRSHKGL